MSAASNLGMVWTAGLEGGRASGVGFQADGGEDVLGWSRRLRAVVEGVAAIRRIGRRDAAGRQAWLLIRRSKCAGWLRRGRRQLGGKIPTAEEGEASRCSVEVPPREAEEGEVAWGEAVASTNGWVRRGGGR